MTSTPTMGAYDFTETQDWFTHNVTHWKSLFSHISSAARGNCPRILEIGSWEGRSAVFLCNELLKAPVDSEDFSAGEIVCIDHFDLFQTDAGKERYKRLQNNLALTGKRFRVIPEFSFTALTKLLNEAVAAESLPDNVTEQGFDWVYVDGSHRSDDTLLDGEMAWRLTRKGGLLIFDDYLWNAQPDTSIHHPRRGIDAFLAVHCGEYERLSAKSGAEGEGEEYQVVLKKTVDMRIGYLLPPSEGDPSPISVVASSAEFEAFDYGINVGVTADTSYAMPLAVLLQSLLDHTPGRISVYLLDCGLSDADKARIHRAFSSRPGATLNLLPIPDNGVTTELGSAVWAKVDLAAISPVERLLYLDADILIRGDVHALWETDLGGCAIGAALDIGHPIGHTDLPSNLSGAKYFNAGVIIMDLAKMRAGIGIETLKERCREMKDSTFADQDALNVHFSGSWKEISLRWNAQGLGTYANSDAPGRELVNRDDLADPSIVHFTGPCHPPLEIVLNPWVQPYTAKPWGYAGSPGHPFAKEWLGVLRRSAFSEYFDTVWKEVCRSAKRQKERDAIEKFDTVIEDVDFYV